MTDQPQILSSRDATVHKAATNFGPKCFPEALKHQTTPVICFHQKHYKQSRAKKS